jgi:hypothetical protein
VEQACCATPIAHLADWQRDAVFRSASPGDTCGFQGRGVGGEVPGGGHRGRRIDQKPINQLAKINQLS